MRSIQYAENSEDDALVISASLKRECSLPVEVRPGVLEDPIKTTKAWSDDRRALSDCGKKHKSLVKILVSE